MEQRGVLLRSFQRLWMRLEGAPRSWLQGELRMAAGYTGWVERILKISGDGVRNVLTEAGLNLLQHYTTTPTMEDTRRIFGLKQRGQLRFEILIFEILKLNLHRRMGFFVLTADRLPDFKDLWNRI
jgi:hypothetical protein